MANVPVDLNRPARKSRFASTTALDRADQDISTWKDSIAAKERFDKQVKSNKANMFGFSVDPYRASVPPKEPLVKPEVKVAPEVKPKPEVRVDPYKASVPPKEPLVNPKPVVNPKPEVKVESVVKPKPEVKVEPVVKAAPVVKVEPVVKAAPVVKAKAPVATEVLVNRLTGAKYDMAKMRDAYEDLGYAKDFKEKHPEEYAKHRGLEYNKPKGVIKTTKTFAKGGHVKLSAPSRGDGCAIKGKTKGRFV